jgi:GNAT superfamily N-acetyltransferase
MTEIEIRPLTNNDAGGFNTLVTAVVNTMNISASGRRTTIDRLQADFGGYVDLDRCAAFGGFISGGQLVGAVLAEDIPGENPKMGLDWFGVAEGYRRQGIAVALLGEAERWNPQASGVIETRVPESGASHALLAGQGYVIVGLDRHLTERYITRTEIWHKFLKTQN